MYRLTNVQKNFILYAIDLRKAIIDFDSTDSKDFEEVHGVSKDEYEEQIIDLKIAVETEHTLAIN